MDLFELEKGVGYFIHPIELNVLDDPIFQLKINISVIDFYNALFNSRVYHLHIGEIQVNSGILNSVAEIKHKPMDNDSTERNIMEAVFIIGLGVSCSK